MYSQCPVDQPLLDGSGTLRQPSGNPDLEKLSRNVKKFLCKAVSHHESPATEQPTKNWQSTINILVRFTQGMDGNGGMGLSSTIIMDHSLIPYEAPVSPFWFLFLKEFHKTLNTAYSQLVRFWVGKTMKTRSTRSTCRDAHEGEISDIWM